MNTELSYVAFQLLTPGPGFDLRITGKPGKWTLIVIDDSRDENTAYYSPMKTTVSDPLDLAHAALTEYLEWKKAAE